MVKVMERKNKEYLQFMTCSRNHTNGDSLVHLQLIRSISMYSVIYSVSLECLLIINVNIGRAAKGSGA